MQRLEDGTSAEEPYNVIVGGQLRYVRTDIFTSVMLRISYLLYN